MDLFEEAWAFFKREITKEMEQKEFERSVNLLTKIQVACPPANAASGLSVGIDFLIDEYKKTVKAYEEMRHAWYELKNKTH